MCVSVPVCVCVSVLWGNLCSYMISDNLMMKCNKVWRRGRRTWNKSFLSMGAASHHAVVILVLSSDRTGQTARSPSHQKKSNLQACHRTMMCGKCKMFQNDDKSTEDTQEPWGVRVEARAVHAPSDPTAVITPDVPARMSDCSKNKYSSGRQVSPPGVNALIHTSVQSHSFSLEESSACNLECFSYQCLSFHQTEYPHIFIFKGFNAHYLDQCVRKLINLGVSPLPPDSDTWPCSLHLQAIV